LPLCSYSVIPIAIGIRRANASKTSTANFMVATPETRVDSISVTLTLLGPVITMGLALDWKVEPFQILVEVSQSKHGNITSLLYSTSAIVITVLIIWQYKEKLHVK
jgi:hypothetical protein